MVGASLLSNTRSANVFFQATACVFVLFILSFKRQKFLVLHKSILSI